MVGVGKVGRTGDIGRGEQQRTCRVSMACIEEKSQLTINYSHSNFSHTNIHFQHLECLSHTCHNRLPLKFAR